MKFRPITDVTSATASSSRRICSVLWTAALVRARAEGTRRLYTIDARGVNLLRDWLDDVWDNSLAAFKEAAELEAREGMKAR